METSRALGELIRESRLERGMSLAQLATAVGRSSSSVRRWERGEVAPAITVIPDLARVLEIEEDSLTALRPTPTGEDGVDDAVPAASGDARADADGSMALSETEGESVASRTGGVFADALRAMLETRPAWVGWVRGVATAVAVLVMIAVAVWALGELWDAFGEILDSFDVGGTG